MENEEIFQLMASMFGLKLSLFKMIKDRLEDGEDRIKIYCLVSCNNKKKDVTCIIENKLAKRSATCKGRG